MHLQTWQHWFFLRRTIILYTHKMFVQHRLQIKAYYGANSWLYFDTNGPRYRNWKCSKWYELRYLNIKAYKTLKMTTKELKYLDLKWLKWAIKNSYRLPPLLIRPSLENFLCLPLNTISATINSVTAVRAKAKGVWGRGGESFSPSLSSKKKRCGYFGKILTYSEKFRTIENLTFGKSQFKKY